MSAKFIKEDRHWLSTTFRTYIELLPEEEAMISSAFDTETDGDVKLIKKEISQIRFLKKVCITKLAVFPLEYVLSLFLFTKTTNDTKLDLAKLYYKFLSNKIDLPSFKKELQQFIKTGATL